MGKMHLLLKLFLWNGHRILHQLGKLICSWQVSCMRLDSAKFYKTEVISFQLEASTLMKPSGQSGSIRRDPAPVRGLRLQDAQLQEMSDEGFCLSMHQPWASYLVAGIKLHEGRTWYSPHRGRLWIHSASKEPTREEIQQVQRQYCLHHGGSFFHFLY